MANFYLKPNSSKVQLQQVETDWSSESKWIEATMCESAVSSLWISYIHWLQLQKCQKVNKPIGNYTWYVSIDVCCSGTDVI
jgi:hypothetical protein